MRHNPQRRAAILFLVIWLIAGSAVYFFAPWINTKTTSQYSEIRFVLLRRGTPTNEVVARIGPPLMPVYPNADGAEYWVFTHWGDIIDWDGTWFARWLVISNGVVVEKHASR